MFTSNTFEWSTPQAVYDKLNDEFHFTLDPCATDLNHKCDKYYTLEDDGLKQDWTGERVFLNPPYGRQIGNWMKKLKDSKVFGVALIPARTDTRWFWDNVLGTAEIRFIKGRIKFGDGKGSAPFASLLAIYDPAARIKMKK